jgi:hypothetical protein
MSLASVLRLTCIASCFVLLSACSGSLGSHDDRTEGSLLRLTGSVGDGPVVGAHMQVTDANGKVLMESMSDDAASYRLTLPSDAALPVLIRATGGTDLVTGRELDFTLYAAALQTGALTVNVSPLTTVAVRAAQCLGGVSEDHLQRAWQRVFETLSMGLDPSLVADPMGDPVTAGNVEAVVLANEALGETVRRAQAALAASSTPLDGDALLAVVACDLMGVGTHPQSSSVDQRVVLTFKAAELAVRLEALAGRLEVDGWSAVSRMNDSITRVMPSVVDPSVADVPVTEGARTQALALIALFQAGAEGAAFGDVASTLATASLADLPRRLDAALTPAVHGEMYALTTSVALADDTVLDDLALRRDQQPDAAAPLLALSADPAVVVSGASSQLSWASGNAEQCSASGGWEGDMPLSGTFDTGPVSQWRRFDLTCTGLGGVTTRSVTVAVEGQPEPEPADELDPLPEPEPSAESDLQPAPEPEPTPEPESAPEPSVQLVAADSVVGSGGSTTLSWSSGNASTCSASGGWSGSKSVAGSQNVGPIVARTTYSLSCSGNGGSAVAMISVAVNGTVTLNWQAPTENVDGSPLTDLSRYRIHYGLSSRNYTRSVAIDAAGTTSHDLLLESGQYYFAMTAVDAQGNESAYSNEVVKVVD